MAVVSQNKQEDLVTNIMVEVGKDDYLPQVNKSLRKIAQTAEMKGFRKGKVPFGMIKKMYGNNVLAEELDKILQDELYTYLQKEEINFLGRPIPLEGENPEMSLAKENDYKFSFELGLSPEIDVKGETGSFTKYKVVVDDKTLDSEVMRMRRQFGKMSHPETIEDNDVLKVQFVEVDGKNNIIEGGVLSETHVDLKMVQDEAVKKDILKLKKGGDIAMDVFKAFGKSPEEIGKHILNVEADRLAEMGSRFKMTVQDINHLGPADLNEEFFAKVFPDNEVKDEAGMRAKMTEIISENFGQSSDAQLRKDVRDEMLKQTEIPLPDNFLKKFIRLNNKEQQPEEQLEEGYGNFSSDLRWTLIRNKMSRERDIKVEMEEVREHANRDMEQRMQYYGYGQLPEDQMQGIIDNSLKDKEYSDRIFSIVLEDKLFKEILEKLDLSEQDISIDDFKKLNEHVHA